MIDFPASREAALARFEAFLPDAGETYAARRNYDLPGHPHVSVLSPYIRYRTVTEEEVLRAVLKRHSASDAQKFIQEVFWRTYWKGWLEMRPSVWQSYRSGVVSAWDRVQTESGLRSEWEAACKGETGIVPFDHWAKQLVAENYLHNHARMWFASIWIFTLRLPWELGADFFLRHLLDGDPASNTLSWRWVAGLQTKGKNYIALASNIAKYTEGRFDPDGRLAPDPAALGGPPHPEKEALVLDGAWDRSKRTGLLITEEDLSPGWLLDAGLDPAAIAHLDGPSRRSLLETSRAVKTFVPALMEDAVERLPDRSQGVSSPDHIVEWAASAKLDQIITSHMPTGPCADRLAGLERQLADRHIVLRQPVRPYDAMTWPKATAGFFKFKESIPRFLTALRDQKLEVA
ncbi:FAD-binding domain-containing protein [Aestuariibius sp. 2305UL40-4]|uniref:FAD-binding domain-containing protein n=1 Tax=Aestuariibius violaceus TaxID=3234132 RepID=UPI00345E1962